MEPTTHELTLTRLIDAPRERVFAAWTDAEKLTQWFTPRPVTMPVCEVDPVTGGKFHAVMRLEDGTEFPVDGVFLEVIAPERIVTTDAYLPGWIPSEKPFFTTVITFEEEEDGKTRYTARARHWRAEDQEQHEKMGFFDGWGKCIDQLEAQVTKD